MIGSYTIEFPISQELPYQQLYRGRKIDQSVQLLHIFPTSSLSESMYSQIIQRSHQYSHIQELIEDDLAILIAYKDSHLWSMIQSKLNSTALHKLLPNLYYLYLELGEGYIDFNPEFVFQQNDIIYLMDYGLNESNIPKTQLFALQILSWIEGKPVQLKQNQQMQREIEHYCGKYRISSEILDLLLLMISNTIPFESLQDLKIFSQNRHIQTVISTVDIPTIKQNTFMQLLSQRKQSDTQYNKKAIRPQSQDMQHISQNLHLSKVKAAVNRNNQQYTSTKQKLGSTCSQYRIAQFQVTKNLKNNSIYNGFSMTSTQQCFTSMKTQQSFFQPAQTSKQFFVEPPKQQEFPKKQESTEAKIEPKQQSKQMFLEPPKIQMLSEVDTKTKIPQIKTPPQQFINEKNISKRQDTQELEQLDIGKQDKTSKQQEFKKPSQTTEFKQPSEIQVIQVVQQDQYNNNQNHSNNINNDNIKTNTNTNVNTITSLEKISDNKKQITEPIPVAISQEQKQFKTTESENLLEEPKISKPTATVNTKIIQNQMLEQVHQDYFDKYNNYLSIINIIGITTADINLKLAASTAIWVMPLSVIFKRLYQIRMKVQQDLELKKNMFKLSKFKEFLNTPYYNQLLTHIKEQNEITKTEFTQMVLIAEKMAPKLDEAGRLKIMSLLKADLDKDLRDHAYAYLYQQIYSRVKKIINQVRGNQMPKNKYTIQEWLLLRFQILVCSLILLMPMYQINDEYHDSLLYSEIMKSNDEQEIEQECETLEQKINNIR